MRVELVGDRVLWEGWLCVAVTRDVNRERQSANRLVERLQAITQWRQRRTTVRQPSCGTTASNHSMTSADNDSPPTVLWNDCKQWVSEVSQWRQTVIDSERLQTINQWRQPAPDFSKPNTSIKIKTHIYFYITVNWTGRQYVEEWVDKKQDTPLDKLISASHKLNRNYHSTDYCTIYVMGDAYEAVGRSVRIVGWHCDDVLFVSLTPRLYAQQL